MSHKKVKVKAFAVVFCLLSFRFSHRFSSVRRTLRMRNNLYLLRLLGLCHKMWSIEEREIACD